MSTSIAEELHTIVTRAAMPIRPGESIKMQMNRAWANPGRPPFWRIRSAWYRDGSGSWSALAVRDFQERLAAWRQQEQARTAEQITSGTADAAHPRLAARLDAIRAGLADLLRQVDEIVAEVASPDG